MLLPFLLVLISVSGLAQSKSNKSKSSFMIRHTVVLKLKYPKGSHEEADFMAAAAKLSAIPGVYKFESLRQTSKENDYDYGFSMEFNSRKDYEAYLQHPEHTKFVDTYWVKYVEKYLEIDYEPMK